MEYVALFFFVGPLHSFLQERVCWARAQYQRSVEGLAMGRKGNLLESKTFHIHFYLCVAPLPYWNINSLLSSGLSWRPGSRTWHVCFRKCSRTSSSRSPPTLTNLWLTASALSTLLIWRGMEIRPEVRDWKYILFFFQWQHKAKKPKRYPSVSPNSQWIN